ncbi:MAG TPA: methionyl-tRNA formyltransferase [Candidatus Saccharimonadales bacterium]|nr:methionyl-tRNA formyltransferase [Candidatus Saccharimonadales bacterium]
MRKISEKIVFFGSGPVAAQSLELLAGDFEIEAVVTKPKPPHHRGEFPVIATAEKLGLPIHTVSSKAELSKLIAARPFRSRLGVLIDFGIIVGQDTIGYFPLGIVNSHFSVLPEWRGADPISFAILSGQKQTGISLMLLVEAMDEGPLIAYGEYDLPPDITAPLLTTHLIHLSYALLKEELPHYMAGKHSGAPQNITGRKVSYSRKLTKQDGVIDWAKPAVELEREIRAFIEWPKSRTQLGGKEVILTGAQVVDGRSKPGEILEKSQRLVIATSDKALEILRLKPAGKREMSAKEFLAGYGQQLS